jgi:hypothetical protein
MRFALATAGEKSAAAQKSDAKKRVNPKLLAMFLFADPNGMPYPPSRSSKVHKNGCGGQGRGCTPLLIEKGSVTTQRKRGIGPFPLKRNGVATVSLRSEGYTPPWRWKESASDRRQRGCGRPLCSKSPEAVGSKGVE